MQVEDQYNYGRMLDIRGCQIKLDESSMNLRCHKPPFEINDCDNQHYESDPQTNNVNTSTTQAKEQKQKIGKEETAAIINGYVVMIDLKIRITAGSCHIWKVFNMNCSQFANLMYHSFRRALVVSVWSHC